MAWRRAQAVGHSITLGHAPLRAMTAREAVPLSFHHVGIACSDIVAEANTWRVLGYTTEGDPFSDTAQGVQGMFLAGQAPRLELLQPLAEGGEGVLAPWLRTGHKMYHLAYETPELARSIDGLRRLRARRVVEPIPAGAS